MTIYRALVRNNLIQPRKRRRRHQDYQRRERAAPMQLWQLDTTGQVMLASGHEVKLITGVDDHSRYCVIARVVEHASGRAVCAGFVAAMGRYGVPEEVLTDNGKQLTGRFGRPTPGEVLFERICRKNGITQRLTKPRSPITTGKVARFHQTVQGELLDELVEGLGPFPSLEVAQELVDAWAEDYNTRRPHQALGMRTPAERFQPDQRHPGADGQPGSAVDAEASTTPQLRTTQQTRKEPMPEPAACPGLAARRALASAQSMGSIVAGTVQNRNGASRICGRYLRMVGAWGLCRTKSSSAARSPAGDPRIRLVNDHVPQRPGGVHDSTGNAARQPAAPRRADARGGRRRSSVSAPFGTNSSMSIIRAGPSLPLRGQARRR